MKFTGEILILLLLLITNGRIFFLKRVKQDRIVVIAPICFLLSILQFFAWGIDLFLIAIFLLSTLVLLSNFHALFRYSEKLYIDHYSPLMYVWCIITTILSLIIIAGTIYFMPAEIQNQKLSIEETKYTYSGNFRSGFDYSRFTLSPKLTVYKFSQAPDNSHLYADEVETSVESPKKNIIIFLPDKTGDTYHYKPYLQHLAQEGYIVYSGDFFSSDCRWMHNLADSKALRRNIMTWEKLASNKKFMQQREFYNYNIFLECKEMFKIVTNLEQDPDNSIILFGDEMSSTALEDFYNNNKTKNPNLKGYFLINTLESYETPGFGCVKQTDPIVANLLGISRDYAFTDIHKMTKETISLISNLN